MCGFANCNASQVVGWRVPISVAAVRTLVRKVDQRPRVVTDTDIRKAAQVLSSLPTTCAAVACSTDPGKRPACAAMQETLAGFQTLTSRQH